ncbi:hypothetical protein Tco_0509384 [Tanacetum coccineum]
MTNGREDSPPPGFLTLTPLPNPNVGELPPITASTFTTRSLNNTPLANRASTSTNYNPAISPTFVEANYEILESLLRDRIRHVRNEDLRTKSDYYNEEMEMEPRPNFKKFQTEMEARLKENTMAGGLKAGVMEETFPHYSQPT